VSRIYFHSPTDDVEVSGTERAWMGCLTDDIGMATLDGHLIRRISEFCDVSIFGRRPAQITLDVELADRFRLAARHSGFDDATDHGTCRVTYQGHPLRPGSISINTALAVGSAPVQLAARLHNQCEIHCWVDGPNRAWLADLIGTGLATGVFRDTPGRTGGWAAVAAFLHETDTEPAVTSYSVCDQFPNPDASTWMPAWPDGVPERWDALDKATQDERTDRSEAWNDLTDEEQWRHGMDWLRAQPGRLELVPEDFGASSRFGFGGNPLTWLDFEQSDAEARVRAALGLDPTT